MKKQKFYRYNKQSLQYEEIKVSLLQRIAQISLAVILMAGYCVFIYNFSTPDSIKAYLLEREMINKKIANAATELNDMSGALVTLKEKDDNLYRTTLEMDQIDETMWDGGVGGSVKHPELEQLKDGGQLLEIAKKMQKVKHQMTVVAESQDVLLSKTTKDEKRLRAIPATRPLHILERPVSRSSGFGMRRDPVNKSVWQMHPGIDLGAPMGAPIFSTGDGTVVRVQYKRGGYGLNVVIDHGYGYKTLYAHMSIIDVKLGQKIKRGEMIGAVGSTGYSTCPHLHYEVFFNNKRIDPEPFIADMSNDEFKELARMVDPEISFKRRNYRRYRRR